MMTLEEMKRVYIGLYVAEDGFCCTGIEYDKKGFGQKVHIDESWYHIDFYRMIDDIGGPVTDKLIDAIEDSMEYYEYQKAKERKEQIRKENNIPPGWFYMTDWTSGGQNEKTAEHA